MDHGKLLTRQQFSRRLYSLVIGRGWTQSELARRSGITRDSISNYIRGNNMPDPVNLQKLAETFGVTSEELVPHPAEQSIEEEAPLSLSIRASASDPSQSRMQINQIVRTSGIPKILEALEAASIPNQDRSTE